MSAQSSLKQFRFRLPRLIWLDLAVLAGALASINHLSHPNDFGWLAFQPTPHLLVPLFIGARYGTLGGLIAGVLMDGLILGRAGLRSPEQFQHLAMGYPLLWLAMPLLGAITGELFNARHRRELELKRLNDQFAEKLKLVDADLGLLRESKGELERILATRDSEYSTLDGEMRRLMESDPEEICQQILLLLNRQSRVSDAALYLFEDSQARLVRKAHIGVLRGLPEQTDAQSIEIVRLAMQNKAPVTVPEFWNKSLNETREYLAAFPLLDSRDEPLGLVLITHMPFIALHRRAVQLMSLICRWAGRTLEIQKRSATAFRVVAGLENQRVFNTSLFLRTLELSFSSFRLHNIPSSVVLFSMPDAPADRQPELERAILAMVRVGDYPAQAALPCPNLAILLPLTGDRGARIFTDRAMAYCRRATRLADQIEVEVLPIDASQGELEILKRLALHETPATHRP